MRRASRHKQRGFWGAIIPAVASIAGAAIASDSQESTNDANAGINSAQMAFNQAEARENRTFQQYEADQSRQWQEAMASTSYRRAINDMQAAGINPMLAFSQGGAATPGGATAHGSQASAGSQIPMGNVAQAGINGAMAAAQIANINSTTKVNEAQEKKIEAEIPNTIASTGQITQNTEVLKETIPKIKAEIEELTQRGNLHISNQSLNGYKYELTKIQTELEKERITFTQAQTAIQKVLNQLYKYDLPGAKNQADYQSKDMPSQVSPALRDLGAIINGAGAMRGMAR